jgi:predicted metalloprotease
MKWEDFRQSDNIEDRRGGDQYADSGQGSGGIAGLGASGHLGLGTIVVLGLIGYAMGIDPRVLIGGAEMVQGMRGGQAPVVQQQQARPAGQKDQLRRFVASVLAENEDVWKTVLPEQKGIEFTPATVVLFSGTTSSGCGAAQTEMGPFYCPNDKKIYLDMSFFREMQQRFGGGGDFAYAYVIAHEMGHHIQDQLRLLPRMQEAQQNAASKADANAISVKIELQADCYAGVWAANANQKWQVIEPGDVEKAVATAQAIGDDHLQQQARGTIMPDSFTHGTSAQRVYWLQRGLQSGQMSSCDTFAQQ